MLQYFGFTLMVLFAVLVIGIVIIDEYEDITGNPVKKWITDAVGFSVAGYCILLFIFVCCLIYYII